MKKRAAATGSAWLLEHRPDIFAGIRYAINEGGITETTQERITYFGIEIGTKMTVQGAAARARPAVDAGAAHRARAVHHAASIPIAFCPKCASFCTISRRCASSRGSYLDDINRTIAADKFWLLPARLSRADAERALAGEDRVRCARRHDARQPLQPARRESRRAHRLAARLRGALRRDHRGGAREERTGAAQLAPHADVRAASPRSRSGNTRGTRTAREVLAASYNDSRYLRARGIDAYGLMPFPTDWYQTQGIHATDERVRVDWFNAASRCCGASPAASPSSRCRRREPDTICQTAAKTVRKRSARMSDPIASTRIDNDYIMHPIRHPACGSGPR